MTQDELKQLNSALANDAVSAVEVFSAADLVATGTFHYDNPGPDDVEFSTYKLPLSHKYGAATNRIQPFIQGYLGYFHLRQEVSGLGPPPGTLKIRSFNATVGAGLEWHVTDWLSASPRLLCAYSHVWQDFERNVPTNDPTANLIVDWNGDALTLLPSLELAAHWAPGRWNLNLKSSYTFLRVFGVHDTSPLVELGSASHVWRNEVSARYGTPWTLLTMPVSLSGLFARHDLAGDLRQAHFVEHFYEARLGVGFGLPEALQPVREMELSGAYYFHDQLSGYSLGLGFGF